MRENKVKIVKVFNAITLEADEDTTQADALRVLVDSFFSQKMTLSCKYTTGATETNNTCSIIVYGFDGTDWKQVGETSISTGTATFTPTQFDIVGADAETEYDAAFRQDITFTKIKVTAFESGVATNKGTLTAVALVQ